MTKLLLLSSCVATVAAFQAPPMIARPTSTAKVAASGVTMGANIRELRDRVDSVKSTKKITSAMKLVAAAKVRRAQEAVNSGRPFTEAVDGMLGALMKRIALENVDVPLLQKRPVKNVGLLVVTGDRGLCGGYNSAIIKKTEQRIKELKDQGVGVQLFTIGNKGSVWFKRRANIRLERAIGQSPSAQDALALTKEVLDTFYSGELDRIEIIYTTFISMLASSPSVRTIVPLFPDGYEMEGDELFKLTSKDGKIAVTKDKKAKAPLKDIPPETIFEADPAQCLNAILPLYFQGQLLRTLQESVASELAARMSAMQSATDNASDLQDTLEREMNRARQAKITQELMEIIAGSECLT